jgi:hemerythrin-like domain-containing protein
MVNQKFSRRQFLAKGFVMGGGLLASMGASSLCISVKVKSPIEVLTRDHGLMRRILFIYKEIICLCPATQDLPTDLIRQAAKAYQKLADDFHQKLEDEFLFPPMVKACDHAELIEVLWQQHTVDHHFTTRLLSLTSAAIFKDDSNRNETRNTICNLARMMEHHMAWEESDLFPAYFCLVSAKDYRDLSEIVARRQEQIFGCEGINALIAEIVELENILGIHHLECFTPET